MPLKSLEDIARKVAYESLQANWNTFDLARFSPTKTLWDYQQQALKLAIAVLCRYYDTFEDFVPGQDEGADKARKEKLTEWYVDGMSLSPRERASLDLSLSRTRLAQRELLAEFFPSANDENPAVSFQDLCNRMSFWMATGSGKTIVLVKLLEILHQLMTRDEIPVCDVLMLTYREDLITQFERTVAEYNHAPDAPVHIELRELREYPEAKREAPGGLLGRDSTLRVFYYRSDNLSDEHKEAIVDFRNYDNNGQWYVLLDEAHKGGAEDSKRKHIYSILTRAGFLFNFSATFTDTLDLVTTVHNFNLSQFIENGFGKHIAVLKQELAAFKKRGGTDYTDDEKRKVVIKSMLLVAYTAGRVRQLRKDAKVADFYHQPMLMTLVNSVNTDDADLKLYFQQILAIGRGQVSTKVWDEAKNELWEELQTEPPFLYEAKGKVQIAKADIDALTARDVWREVYNFDSTRGGEIEVLVRPGNHQEIAFKMKTSPRPFALISIGDITGWLREHLTGFDYIETLDTESFFAGLNEADSSINILMGSRRFYEGWDSNRPNVINFVNIGMGDDARKFIMQSVGRGVRVQSWNRERRRFAELYESFADKALFRKLRDNAVYPETLYVLGTNREALRFVLEELQKEKPVTQAILQLELNPNAPKTLLLVPEYRDLGIPLIEERAPSKFEITKPDLALLDGYHKAVVDDKVLLLAHGTTPKKVQHFRSSLSEAATYYAREGSRSYRNVDVMVGRVLDYFGLRSKELSRIRPLNLESDIVHFRQMTVDKVHADEIQKKVDRVLFSQTPAAKTRLAELSQKVVQLEMELKDAAEAMENEGLTGRESYNEDLTLEYLANHYYLPVVYSKGKRVDYIRHIVEVESEVRFLSALKEYIKPSNKDCALRQLDWWMFSKLDQYLDDPAIPYYSPKENRIAWFIPDFIFWGRKGKDYTILFVDPKGMENQDWERKADGYIRLFEDAGKPRIFKADDVNVRVRLYYFTRDRNHAAEGSHKRFWMDRPDELFKAGFGL